MKPHLRRRAAASMGAKPYMVLAWSGLYLTNSYLCINRKSTHSSNWYYIKGYVFEKILFKMLNNTTTSDSQHTHIFTGNIIKK